MPSFVFTVDGLTIRVPYEEAMPGQAILPSYKAVPKPDPNNPMLKYSMWAKDIDKLSFTSVIGVDELRDDISSLMPRSLKNVEQQIQERLVATLEKHVAKFGRLLQDDLATYIDEMILVMSSIDEARGRGPLTDEQRKEIYRVMMLRITQQ